MLVRQLPLQIGSLFEAVPWWLPGALIGLGLFCYGVPSVDAFVGARVREWRRAPTLPRTAVVGLLVAGAALVVFTVLGDDNWWYVLFLLGYARAVEGATILHLFGRLDRAMQAVSTGGHGSQRSAFRRAAEWYVARLRKRLPFVVVTGLLTLTSLGLFVSVLVGFPETPLTVRIAAVLTLSTFYSSTVASAWVLTKVTEELTPAAFVGLVLCLVGGELYNVPSAVSLFTDLPAVGGPFEALTTVAVGTIGWFVGLALALVFFLKRFREHERGR